MVNPISDYILYVENTYKSLSFGLFYEWNSLSFFYYHDIYLTSIFQFFSSFFS